MYVEAYVTLKLVIYLDLTLGALPARPAPGARPGHHSLLDDSNLCYLVVTLSLFSNIRSLITTAAGMATRGGPATAAASERYFSISFVINMTIKLI